MSITIQRIHPSFVGEVQGVELSDDHGESTITQLRNGLLEHSMLVFHGQSMSSAEQVRFSQRFGPSEIHTVKQYLLPEFPEIIALANRGEKGTKPIANGGAYWHSDITYKARPPMGSILYGIEVPPTGGDTLYCDMAAAYDGLAQSTKDRIDGLRAVHSYLPRFMAARAADAEFQKNQFELSAEQKAELGEVVHPIVRTHPESGRKALFINEGFSVRVEGMDEEEGKALLVELNQHATQDQFVYRHQWTAGDVVFWDNRMTMHRATEYDLQHSRRMHRTTVQGDVPV
ncbi:MAG: TauD/TfdA family dioxygenase [Chromatiales bacterium]|jgi:taurine dioxygenase|nr:TauD/TfdA family dioxygenase [Chromatiales bacterium]